VRMFKHNDMDDLEAVLRESISLGQPPGGRAWLKVLVAVEGIYSMEGDIVNLPRIIELKKRYKFYLYVDEAHSIGALGPNGRGVCDYYGIPATDVDILMGTLTKSFGAAGGYIGGSHDFISSLRQVSHASNYAEPMSPPIVAQIIASMASIMGPSALEVLPELARTLPGRLIDGREGQERLQRLAFNSRYLSGGLRKLGFIVYGDRDSPIVPLLIYHPSKMTVFSRLLLERHRIVVVVVGYPATPLIQSRVRFCVSAAHTKNDIDRVLLACDDVGGMLGLKLSSGSRWTLEQVINNPGLVAA